MATGDFPSKKEWYTAKGGSGHDNYLANEVDRLTEKYQNKGKDFTSTVQYRSMQDYLDGVPNVRGGNLGRRDHTYGGDFKVDESNFEHMQAQRERDNVLNMLSGVGGLNKPGTTRPMSLEEKVSFMDNLDPKKLRTGLTGDQYSNFRQQMYNADIPAYQKAFPWSSGHAVTTLMENLFVPAPLKIGASIAENFVNPLYRGVVEAGEEATELISSGLEKATAPADWLAREIEKLRLNIGDR
jgi:hypothetical protein